MLEIVIPHIILLRTSNEPLRTSNFALPRNTLLGNAEGYNMKKVGQWELVQVTICGNNVKLLHWRGPRSCKTNLKRE